MIQFATFGAATESVTKLNEGEPYEEATVAEWPVDPGIDVLDEGLDCFTVVMLRDGAVEQIHREGNPWWYGDLTSRFQLSIAPRVGDGPVALVASVWAKDAKHAVKITNEHRLRMIANEEWPKGGDE